METISEYQDFFSKVKSRIRVAQYEALRAVNKELVGLYWDIGKMISEKQIKQGWGKSVVENLAKDLQNDFPGESGYSAYNIWLMVRLYREYEGDVILEPLVPEIGWSHNIVILKKCKTKSERHFYLHATQKFGWTKRALEQQIAIRLFEKYMLSQTSFEETKPTKTSSLNQFAIKDHYTFDFLELNTKHTERELENGLLKNIDGLLNELGNDFCFVGNQYRLCVQDEDFFIDLLLFHRRLHCLFAIELKTGPFKPEYKGKMEFYLAVLNDTVKLPGENDAIGIIICKNKKRLIVEYSLKNSVMPIGVATYSTDSKLPEYYRNLIPEPAQMARSIGRWLSPE